METNEVSGAVVDCAMKVHSALGRDFWRAQTKHVLFASFVSAGFGSSARLAFQFLRWGKSRCRSSGGLDR
jgi:hypothetical protein